MRSASTSKTAQVARTVGVSLAMVWIAAGQPAAQSVAAKETAFSIERALQQLPYYGVFDFLAFGVDRGRVTLQGFAYRETLKSDAVRAVKRVSGVDEVTDNITVLPASRNDDRIRWATFYNIYTDDFLSRYAPGGSTGARYDAQQFARFQGMQPLGTYPIHIIVQNGRTMLLGVVDSEADKTMAGFKAREIDGVFAVENDLVVNKR
jgi:hyperosmotically inducible periplasmic protein